MSKEAEDYESLAATYQLVEIALLNQVLKAHGITDKKKRREICESYFFDQGIIADQGAFQTEPGGKWYKPAPCFTDTTGSPSESFERAERFYRLTDGFDVFHEHALANVASFFDDDHEQTSFDWGPEHE